MKSITEAQATIASGATVTYRGKPVAAVFDDRKGTATLWVDQSKTDRVRVENVQVSALEVREQA